MTKKTYTSEFCRGDEQKCILESFAGDELCREYNMGVGFICVGVCALCACVRGVMYVCCGVCVRVCVFACEWVFI